MTDHRDPSALRDDSAQVVRGIEKVLAFTDLSEYGRLAVARASQLGAQHGAAIRIVHVVAPPLGSALAWSDSDEARRRIEDAAPVLAKIAAKASTPHSIQISTEVRAGPLLKEILRVSDAADLLVLGALGLRPIRQALLGTTAIRLLTKCDRPMLVVRQEAVAPYRRIVVPVDLEDGADTTLQAVLALAPDAAIHVLHAYELSYEGKLRMAGVGATHIRRNRQAAKARMKARLIAMLGYREQGAQRFHLHLQRGHAGRLILALAARIDADLIVMSKRGRSKLEDLLLGSVTQQVVSDARTDVLVIPPLAGETRQTTRKHSRGGGMRQSSMQGESHEQS